MAERKATRNGFEIYGVHIEGRWYWRLRRNGRIVADGSEAYATKASAVRAVRALAKWLKAPAAWTKDGVL